MRVLLPGDQWADIKDVDDLREGDRKAVRKNLEVATDDEGNMLLNVGMADAMYDAMYREFITAWSFEGRPIPAELPGTLDTLTLKQGKALKKAFGEHYELIWGDGDEDPTADSTS